MRSLCCPWLLMLFALLLPISGVCADRPNIIFVLTDDQGYGDLSCHGNPILKTPHLDRFHGESVRFTDFQVSPLCAPTRAALLTGRHEYRSGVHDTRNACQNLDLKAVTIAQVLQSSGYATGLFGKWHLGLEQAYRPNNRGFDHSLGFLTGMIHQGNPANVSQFNCILLRNGVDEQTKGFCTDVFFTEATKWIDTVRGKRPFFAYLALNAPHGPVACPPEYAKPYEGKVRGETMPTYYGEIANIDDNFGRLMDQLRAWDLERDTLVIFMTDNGAPGFRKDGVAPTAIYNAGMKGAKGSVDEGGTRVPSFWRLPAAFTGGVDVERLASNIDFFPTLAELAGVKLPEELRLDGRSLVPLLKDPKADWSDRFVFIHASNWDGDPASNKSIGYAVRSERFRLVGANELFDIKADRGQTRNVLADHPDVAARMQTAYDAWWDEVLPALEANHPRGGASAKPTKPTATGR